jgi:hypothetical protein
MRCVGKMRLTRNRPDVLQMNSSHHGIELISRQYYTVTATKEHSMSTNSMRQREKRWERVLLWVHLWIVCLIARYCRSIGTSIQRQQAQLIIVQSLKKWTLSSDHTNNREEDKKCNKSIVAVALEKHHHHPQQVQADEPGDHD